MDISRLIEIFRQPESWISLVTLSAMEVVLGIDNIVFLSILAGKLPREQQGRARRVGLTLALGMRIALLLGITWVMGLTTPLFSLLERAFSGRDMILLGGGLFLIGKSTHEIFDKLEVSHEEQARRPAASFAWIVVQILVLDAVFSLDSVITAVGMAKELAIMIVAVAVSIGIMLVFAGAIGDFVNRHPSVKVLALSFLLMIGVMLVAEGMGQHINKGYVYFAMAFSLLVELLNMRVRKQRQAPVELHHRFEAEPPA